MRTPKQTIEYFLKNTINMEIIATIVEKDAVCISLSFGNTELQKILPWAGVHSSGPIGFFETFYSIQDFWIIQQYQLSDILAEGEKVAAFGIVTYRSKTLDKEVTSPFSILAKVKDEKIYHLMMMEDTLATTSSFRITTAGTFHSDPKGELFTI